MTDGAGKGFQSAIYEGDSHRWFRSTWAEGSKALITLRDASGKVVADFMESNATSGLVLQKEYVHADGQLLAINSACGPRPALKLSDPATANGQVWFDKTDYVTAAGTYSVFISTDLGQSKTLTEPSNLANHFGIAQSEFWQGVTNYVSIEADAACGHTGYSNAVSYVYAVAPQNGSCLTSVGASRTGFNGSGSSIEVGAQGSCATGTAYNVYFQRAGSLDVVKLNAIAPLTAPKVQISNVPCGSGEGDYWLTPIAPGTTTEGPASPKVTLGSGDCGGGGDPGGGHQPGRTSVNLQFVHSDHLGSTRAVTDEHGVLISAFKYFPFGMEAETSGDEVRQKFTGHERDDRVGLDYMMARSCRMALGRFLEPDEYGGSARPELPQSWNRYAYVENTPVNATDPSGYLQQLVVSPSPAMGWWGNATSESHSGTWAQEGGNQPDNGVQNNLPREVKQAAKDSVEAMMSPSEAAGDPKGEYHEEGGFWGRDASGGLVVVPAVPGKANFDPKATKTEMNVMHAADPTLALRVVSVEGTWHVHPSGTMWDSQGRSFWGPRPSDQDIQSAKAPINFVVGPRWREVNFYNSRGMIGKPIPLKKFFKE